MKSHASRYKQHTTINCTMSVLLFLTDKDTQADMQINQQISRAGNPELDGPGPILPV